MTAKWELGLQKVKDGVYAYITEGYTMMSNAALIVGDNCAFVFDGLTSAKIGKDFYEQCRKVTDKPIRYLVYSHAHGDHFLGANAFPEALKIAHISTKEFFRKEADKGYDRWEGKLFPWVDFEGSCACYPDIFIDSDTVFDLGGREVQIKVTKKLHTAADLYAIIPDANVVCCGDLLFASVCPNGRPQGFFEWVNVLKQLADLNADAYIPGHGPVCGREGLMQSREFLKKVIAAYMKMCNGKSLEQAVEEIDWSVYAESWLEPGRCYSDTDRLFAIMTDSAPNIPISPGLENSLNEKIRKVYNLE